jgi:hypothetical protein
MRLDSVEKSTGYGLTVAHALAALRGFLLLALDCGWLEMLATPDLGKYTVGLHTLIETPEEAVESLPIGQTYFSQLSPL